MTEEDANEAIAQHWYAGWLAAHGPLTADPVTAVIEGALDGSVILGQIAQLADGDMPHRARGCPAQATSVAELIRALVVDLGV